MHKYGINHNIAHKFNLKGLSVGDTFLGCIPCQKIYAVNACGVPECGNCLGKLNSYKVTLMDVGDAPFKIEGDFCGGVNDIYQAEEKIA